MRQFIKFVLNNISSNLLVIMSENSEEVPLLFTKSGGGENNSQNYSSVGELDVTVSTPCFIFLHEMRF